MITVNNSKMIVEMKSEFSQIANKFSHVNHGSELWSLYNSIPRAS